jgi:hypothetical protein
MKIIEHAVWAHLGWDAFFWLSAVRLKRGLKRVVKRGVRRGVKRGVKRGAKRVLEGSMGRLLVAVRGRCKVKYGVKDGVNRWRCKGGPLSVFYRDRWGVFFWLFVVVLG